MEDLAASIAIKNKNNVWVSDNMVTSCHNCQAEFGLFTRKHHCRNCGNIFCYTCCHDMIVIPDFISDRPEPADYWNISYYVSSLKTPEERVCRQCRDIIRTKVAAYDKIINILDNPISIDKIKALPETETNVKNHYFDHLRNIQYYLPNHRYTDIDRKLLRINAPYFSRHSKYLVHFIKSIDWSLTPIKTADMSLEQSIMTSSISRKSSSQVQRQFEFVMSVINGEKNKKCSELYCTRTCQEQLSCDDCINILYGNGLSREPVSALEMPIGLLNYLFDIISSSPEQIIICHLSFFISLIRINSSNKVLQMHIFNLLNRSIKLTYQSYWFLNNACETATDLELRNIKSFIKLFNPQIVQQMHREYIFYSGIIKNLSDVHRYLLGEFDRYKPISLPYEPQLKLISVDLDTITQIKSSHTKPVIITFEVKEFSVDDELGEVASEESIYLRLLFKADSIMNDVTVLNLMTLSDIILKESLDTNFSVVVYPLIPLTANSGMIEIVENAETVHEILNKSPSILQYIMEKNNDRIVGEVLDHYLYSLVSYTLHSYFIGLGDRHLQNIMITDDGAIFHIDFGFILGTDAYPITATDIKLNSGMLDVIGGSNGQRYIKYLELSAKGVVLLRKYFNMFYILFSIDSKFKEKHIDRFVMTRFQPRQMDTVVIDELISIIKQSNSALSSYIRDFLHYHTQEKTIQDGLVKIFHAAFGAVKSFSGSN